MIAGIWAAIAGRAEALWIVAGFAIAALVAWLRRDAASDALRDRDAAQATEAAATTERTADAMDAARGASDGARLDRLRRIAEAARAAHGAVQPPR